MKSRRKKPAHQADFEDIYERHSREVWALVYARWLNADIALDIMQESFLRLWKQWQEGSDIVNPRAWVLRVARNLAEDHAKSAFRRFGTQPPQTMNGVEGRDGAPLDGMTRAETFGQLRKELDRMAPATDSALCARLRYERHRRDTGNQCDRCPHAFEPGPATAGRTLDDSGSTGGAMTNLSTRPQESRPEVDALLRDYFESEMPRPWPAFKAPITKPVSWSRYTGRLALAASVALLVAGYLTLAGFFPRTQSPTGIDHIGGPIGKRDKGPNVVVPAPEPE
jgi:RNA polymerase sigma-70 factor, ECF subfamily